MDGTLAQVRGRFPMPTWDRLCGGDRDVIMLAEARASLLPSIAGGLPDAGLRSALRPAWGYFPSLTDRIGASAASRWTAFQSCERSRTEMAVLRRHHERLQSSLRGDSNSDFIQALTEAATDLSGVRGLRRTNIGSRSDEAGRFVVYPPPGALEEQLRMLFIGLRNPASRPLSFDAIVSLVWVTHCHPFTDGNGRLSRVLFNSLLQRHAPVPSFYLPVYELAALSMRGYVIAVRRAELRHEWNTVSSFVAEALRIWTDVLRGTGTEPAERNSGHHAVDSDADD